jgi:hypothetical protein
LTQPAFESPTSFPWRKGSPPIERIMKKTIVITTQRVGIVQSRRRKTKRAIL